MLAAAILINYDVGKNTLERRKRTYTLNKFVRELNNPMHSMSEERFRRHYRMTPRIENALINLVAPYLNYNDVGIEPHHQVLAVIRFLAEGSYQKGVSADACHLMSQSAFSKIVHKVIPAINQLTDHFVAFPRNRVEREAVSRRFEEIIGFPGILGAIDCTLPKIHKPTDHEEAYLNYKQQYSLNMQVVSDADHYILNMNIVNGSTNDQFVWDYSKMKDHMYALRTDDEIRGTEGRYYLIGDAGYTPSTILLTPVLNAAPGTPQRNFSDRLRQTRCVVEQLFGILKEIFRCLNKDRSLHYEPLFAAEIVKACGVIYNFLRQNGMPMQVPRRELQEVEVPYQGIRDNREYRRGLAERAAIIENYF